MRVQPGDVDPGGRPAPPLMVVPYLGSMTFFLHALSFAMFGPNAVAGRLVNLLLGAVGIWGVGRFGQRWISPRLGTALAFVLAIHPGYLTWTMYDNGGVAIWMATLGLICLAVTRYIQRFDAFSAFVLGLGVGFAIWCRMNYLWLLLGALLALICVLRARLRSTARHWLVFIAGGAVGALPLIVYEITSRLDTLVFVRASSGQASLLRLIPARLAVGMETLVYDTTRRWIWGGRSLPAWQAPVAALLLVVAIASCLFAAARSTRGNIHRIAALALVFTSALTLTSPIRLEPQHFIVYLPLAAFVMLAAAQTVVARMGAMRLPLVAVGLGYAVIALSWDGQTSIGVRHTGGMGMWSDAAFAVARTIEAEHRDQTITILDWGLTNNLWVLTSGGFRPRELYWGSTSERTSAGTTWKEEIVRGGVYLSSGVSNTFMKAVGEGFRSALETSGLRYQMKEFRQRDGQTYARLYTVLPESKPGEAPTSRRIEQLSPSRAVVGQPFNTQSDGSSALAVQGEGFSRNDRVFWNDLELVTTFGTSGLLTAQVPRGLVDRPGDVTISVRDVFGADRTSPSAIFQIVR